MAKDRDGWYRNGNGEWCYRGKCFGFTLKSDSIDIEFEDKCPVEGHDEGVKELIDRAAHGKPTRYKYRSAK